jgi:hypothetical protein
MELRGRGWAVRSLCSVDIVAAVAIDCSFRADSCSSDKKQEAVTEFYGLPLIGQKQERPMNGAQFHTLWVGYDDERLK